MRNKYGLEEKVNKIEEAILIMKNLLASHDDQRMENYFHDLRESRKDFELKMNALINAQIKNKAEIGVLKEASRSPLNRIENSRINRKLS